MATPPPIASGRYFCEVWLASCLNLTPDRAVMSMNVGEGLEIATAGESSARSNCRRVRAVTFWASRARVLVCRNIPTLNPYCLLFQTCFGNAILGTDIFDSSVTWMRSRSDKNKLSRKDAEPQRKPAKKTGGFFAGFLYGLGVLAREGFSPLECSQAESS